MTIDTGRRKQSHHGATSESDDGVVITYLPDAMRVELYGYFDTAMRIEGESFSLADFLTELGITEADVLRALAAR